MRLRNAGAVLIAKLSTGQFAQGGVWFRGSTKNPWNTSQSSSGSSAGPGVGDGGRMRRVRHRHRNVGLDRVAGDDLRHQRAASDVRPRESVRRNGARVVAGSRRTHHAHGRRCGDGVQRDSRRRSRRIRARSRCPSISIRTSTSRTCGIGVRPQNAHPDPNFTAFVEKLKALGAKPKDIGNPPTVARKSGRTRRGVGGGVRFVCADEGEGARDGHGDVLTSSTCGGGGGGGGGAAPAVAARTVRSRAERGTRPTTRAVNSIAGCRVARRPRWTSSTRSVAVRC